MGQANLPPANLRLQLIQTGGSVLTDEVRQAAAARYGARIVQRYGMSECPGIMAAPGSGAPPGSAGKPNETRGWKCASSTAMGDRCRRVRWANWFCARPG